MHKYGSCASGWTGAVDGFRIDVVHGLVKAPDLPDLGGKYSAGRVDLGETLGVAHPHWDRDGVQEIYQEWRRVADSYAGARIFVAEAWVPDPARLARYVEPDRLHTAFNFDFLTCAWNAAEFRGVIDATLAAHAAVGAPPTWVLSNHDVVRHVTRYGRAHTSSRQARAAHGAPVDLELGTRRARAGALLMLALPGGAYVYQGEELGLWEVEDLPEEMLQDPHWERSGRTERGRDGCRVPVPWSGSQPPFGFSSGTPRLPSPTSWQAVTAEAQRADPASMQALYRETLRLRRGHPALGDGLPTWSDAPPRVLSFTQSPGLRCVVNISDAPFALPEGGEVLLVSGSLTAGSLPADTAVWLSERAD